VASAGTSGREPSSHFGGTSLIVSSDPRAVPVTFRTHRLEKAMAKKPESTAPLLNGASIGLDPYTAWLTWVTPLRHQNTAPLGGDVMQWIRAWGEVVGQVGFLNVNYAGSSDPQAERRISGRYSYGRQLGRIMEVMAPLIHRHQAQLRKEVGDKAVAEFLEMAGEIAAMKQASVGEIVNKVSGWRKSNDFAQKLDQLIVQLTALRSSA
jgi:hypothetical protein